MRRYIKNVKKTHINESKIKLPTKKYLQMIWVLHKWFKKAYYWQKSYDYEYSNKLIQQNMSPFFV